MTEPERMKAKEALNRIADFKTCWDLQFSKGYLNSDGRKAFIRLLKSIYEILPHTKRKGRALLRKASEDEICTFIEDVERMLRSALQRTGDLL